MTPQARLLVLSLVAGLVAVAGIFAVSRYVAEYRQIPEIVEAFPSSGDVGVAPRAQLTLVFNKSMDAETIRPGNVVLRDREQRIIPAVVSYQRVKHSATLSPTSPLLPGSSYEVSVAGGQSGIKDRFGRPLMRNREWSFTTGASPGAKNASGYGGPILVIADERAGFSNYYSEIMRNEGLNEFTVVRAAQISPAVLARHDVVLLGESPLGTDQMSALSSWVKEGGALITMHPEARTARELGFALVQEGKKDEASSDAAEKNRAESEKLKNRKAGLVPDGAYMAISGKEMAGAGLFHEPLQIHGPADRYRAPDATVLATLYEDAKTATVYPAVCSRKLGQGVVVLFSYDLAQSIVYTRQGNPSWSGQDRDGNTPVRADDLFYGADPANPEPDWVDEARIAVPQADIQQRFLSNIITLANSRKKPIPHFWYLPRGLKAAVVMTGDDHGNGGTVGRFDTFLKNSSPGCLLEKWECIRGTSNIFVGSISPEEAARLSKEGFEIALHVYTRCLDWPSESASQAKAGSLPRLLRASVDSLYREQLRAFAAEYPAVPLPVSNRTDCVAWGDYDTQPQVEREHGIRFDTNYYYWPAKWVRNRPGLFTGSGMPMRFARLDGSVIDVYQAATQMTDESQQVYPYTAEVLLNNALGPAEYYGVFTANMHHDNPKSQGADAILAAARSRHVPVVTAAQMLTWLDGRNASSFQDISWSSGKLEFVTDVGAGATGLEALLPVESGERHLVSLKLDGVEVDHPTRVIAGLSYAAFDAGAGKFVATYQ